MAHEIMETDTMFSASGITPWHGLGAVIDKAATSEEALELAGLNWRVRKEALVCENPEWRHGESKGETGWFGVVRDSDARFLGCVQSSYRPLQNYECFAIGDSLFENGARWETAGSLNDGVRVWALLSFDASQGAEGDEVADGDKLLSYLLLLNSHDGHRNAQMLLTTVRVVCANTLRLAQDKGRAETFKFVHRVNIVDRMAQAAEILKESRTQRDAFLDAARKMQSLTLTRDEQIRFLRLSLGMKHQGKLNTRQQNRLDEAVTRLESATCNAMLGETLWSAFNAVTEMTTHSDRLSRRADTDRLVDLSIGRLDSINQKALGRALAMV